jgi:uncharacterized protein (TIGR02266 family)
MSSFATSRFSIGFTEKNATADMAPDLLKGRNMTRDRREFQRAPMSGGVKLFQWGTLLPAEAAQISANGIFVRSKDVLPEGTTVTLRLALPGLHRAITVLGRVVRTVKGGLFAAPGMGIRFLDLLPSEREVVVGYVTRRAVLQVAA